jgi:hypothetical protein
MRHYDIALDIWSKRGHNELELDTYMAETAAAVRACVKRGMRRVAPEAYIARSFITHEIHLEHGREEPGYLVSLRLIAPVCRVNDSDPVAAARRLRNQIESEVTTELRQLVHTMEVVFAAVR